jgi:hypothetical protein
VRPQNVIGDQGAVDGDPEGKKKCLAGEVRHRPVNAGPFDHILTPKSSAVPWGSRLTKDCLAQIDVGEFQPMECKLLFEMLFNLEGAIAFDFTEIGLFRSKVEPPHILYTILYDPWQEAPFKIPRALEAEVIEILKNAVEGLIATPGSWSKRNRVAIVRLCPCVLQEREQLYNSRCWPAPVGR